MNFYPQTLSPFFHLLRVFQHFSCFALSSFNNFLILSSPKFCIAFLARYITVVLYTFASDSNSFVAIFILRFCNCMS
ncbi:hypothetical protein HanPSC8_Chr16g0703241 [Helianthus annuus]|nr:hypothetical protein HanPSC8_Chr16g0703241 [Helianthus annuus]